jgi:hypothetical protein
MIPWEGAPGPGVTCFPCLIVEDAEWVIESEDFCTEVAATVAAF